MCPDLEKCLKGGDSGAVCVTEQTCLGAFQGLGRLQDVSGQCPAPCISLCFFSQAPGPVVWGDFLQVDQNLVHLFMQAALSNGQTRV